jgi:hypothetical protein
MAIFRVQLTDGSRHVKTNLQAPDEVFARMKAEQWFDCGRWQIVEIRRLWSDH